MKTTSDDTGKTAEGNTITSTVSGRKWCFTLNNYSEKEYNDIKLYFQKKKEWIIGKEVGASGTPHLQGYFYSKSAVKFTTLQNINERWHLEKAHGTTEQNYDYCSKEGQFLTNIKRKLELPRGDEVKIKLKGWQLDALVIFKDKPDDRTIYWFYDTEGCKGKSTFVKYILMNYSKCIFFTGGTASDIASQILLFEDEISCCLFDFTREKSGIISIGALEQLKNGLVNSPKYKGGFKYFISPFVMVFANFAPQESKMTKDRWTIRCLDDEIDPRQSKL